MTDPPPEWRRSTVRPPNTDSPRQEADDVHLEVVAVDTRYWKEEGGSYSPDRRYRWRYERPSYGTLGGETEDREHRAPESGGGRGR